MRELVFSLLLLIIIIKSVDALYLIIENVNQIDLDFNWLLFTCYRIS